MNLIGTVSGADVSPGIEGWDIYVQINDGGVDNGYPADVNTPTLTNIDLTTGIFAGSNNSGGNLGENISPDGLIGGDSVATPSGTNLVPSNGILGTLTFNAAGIAPGTTFDVYFYNVASDPSGYFPGGTDSDFNTGSAGNAFSGNYLNYTPTTACGSSPLVLTVGAVPEPTSALLFAGAGAVTLLRRRKLA